MPLITNDIDKQAKLDYLLGQMNLCDLWARFHMTRITSGAAIQGKSSRGLSDEEKIDEALQVVRVHMQRYQDCLDDLDSLLRGEQ